MSTIKPTGRKRAAKNISIYAIGTIVRQLAAFIMLPIYTSYLTPADYGIVALLALMLSLFELVLGARFTQAIPKFYYEREHDRERREVITTALVLTAAVSMLSVSVLAAFSEPIAHLAFDSAGYSLHVKLYCVVLFTAAMEGYGLTYFRIQEKPILFVANSIAKLGLQLGLNIYFVVYLQMGVLGVVYSAVISSTAFGAFALLYILYCNGFYIRGQLVKRFIKFSWPLWLAGLAGLYVGSSGQAYIKVFSELNDVGLFSLALKFSAVLGILIWAPFSQWWQTERFKLYQADDKGVSVFPVVFNAMTIILAIAGMGIVLFGEVVIQLMAAPAFYAAAVAIPFLVVAKLISELTNFFKFSFLVTENTLYMTYIGYGSAVTLTVLLFLLIPPFGFMGAAIATMVNNLLVFAVASVTSRKFFDNQIQLGVLNRVMLGFLAITMINHFFIPESATLLWNTVYKSGLFALFLVFAILIALRDSKLNALYRDLVSYVSLKTRQRRG